MDVAGGLPAALQAGAGEGWLGELAAAAAAIDMRWTLVGLLAALDVWSVWLIQRSDAPARERYLWTTIVLFCPIVGCLFWYVLGPKPRLVPPGARGGMGPGGPGA